VVGTLRYFIAFSTMRPALGAATVPP
jgi:hypothetical protein